MPSRPGRHLHGPVSHVCLAEGQLVRERVKAHPVWVSPEEQESSLLDMDLPLSEEELSERESNLLWVGDVLSS